MWDWLKREFQAGRNAQAKRCSQTKGLPDHCPRWTMGGETTAEMMKHMHWGVQGHGVFERNRRFGSEWQVGQRLYICWRRNLGNSQSLLILGKLGKGASSSDQTQTQHRSGNWFGNWSMGWILVFTCSSSWTHSYSIQPEQLFLKEHNEGKI